MGSSFQYVFADEIIIRTDKYFGGIGTIFGKFEKYEMETTEGKIERYDIKQSSMNQHAKIYVQDKYVQQYKDEMDKFNKIIIEENKYYKQNRPTEEIIYNYEFLPLSEYKK